MDHLFFYFSFCLFRRLKFVNDVSLPLKLPNYVAGKRNFRLKNESRIQQE